MTVLLFWHQVCCIRNVMSSNDDDLGPIGRALVREGFGIHHGSGMPHHTLSTLLDLEGSVRLAEFLDDVIRHPTTGLSIPLHPLSPDMVVKKANAGSARILAKYDKAFLDAYRPYYRLPTGIRAKRLIGSSGLMAAYASPARLQGKAVTKSKKMLVRTLWHPYAEFVQTQLKRGRFAAVELRTEVEGLLAQVSVFAGQLARIDAALQQATKNGADALINGLGPAMERRFIEGLDAFDPGAKDSFEPKDDIGKDDWLCQTFSSYNRLGRAVLEHELRQITQLVQIVSKGSGKQAMDSAAFDSETE